MGVSLTGILPKLATCLNTWPGLTDLMQVSITLFQNCTRHLKLVSYWKVQSSMRKTSIMWSQTQHTTQLVNIAFPCQVLDWFKRLELGFPLKELVTPLQFESAKTIEVDQNSYTREFEGDKSKNLNGGKTWPNWSLPFLKKDPFTGVKQEEKARPVFFHGSKDWYSILDGWQRSNKTQKWQII